MAIMNIEIVHPLIDLIANKNEVSNSCYSIFEFDIISTPSAEIELKISQTLTTVDYAQAKIQGVWQDIPFVANIEDPSTVFNLPSTGRTSVRIKIGNVENSTNNCNSAQVIVQDNTNTNSLGNPTRESKLFSRCVKAARCEDSEVEEPSLGIEIDADTNIIIYVDASGSMNSTLGPLENMRDNLLKDALLPYYNNNLALYNSKVKVVSVTSSSNMYEKTLRMLDYDKQTLEGRVIVLVFQDEALNYINIPFNPNNSLKESYKEDIQQLRSRLLNYEDNYYFGVVFQVDYGSILVDVYFKEFLQAVKGGIGNYSGVNGLRDKNNITVKYDVLEEGNPTYYKNLIVDALTELGFTI